MWTLSIVTSNILFVRSELYDTLAGIMTQINSGFFYHFAMNRAQRRLARLDLASQAIPQARGGRIAAVEHQHQVVAQAETDGIRQSKHPSSRRVLFLLSYHTLTGFRIRS